MDARQFSRGRKSLASKSEGFSVFRNRQLFGAVVVDDADGLGGDVRLAADEEAAADAALLRIALGPAALEQAAVEQQSQLAVSSERRLPATSPAAPGKVGFMVEHRCG
jgi:hypothetical protein